MSYNLSVYNPSVFATRIQPPLHKAAFSGSTLWQGERRELLQSDFVIQLLPRRDMPPRGSLWERRPALGLASSAQVRTCSLRSLRRNPPSACCTSRLSAYHGEKRENEPYSATQTPHVARFGRGWKRTRNTFCRQ